MSSSSSSSKRTTTARPPPPPHHNQDPQRGGGGDHYYNDDARLHSRSSSSSSTRQDDHSEQQQQQQQQHRRGSRGPRAAAVAAHHHYNRRSNSRSPSRRGRQRAGHRRGRRDYEMDYYERTKGSSSKNIITSRNSYDCTTKDTTVGMVSYDEVDDENAHRAAVANAAAVAIAAAKNMAKTQEKHELDRRIAVARKASTTAATAGRRRRKVNKTVLPGFTSVDDDDDEDEQPQQEYPSSRGSSNGCHSGEDSAAAAAATAAATGGALVPPPSSLAQMPIHTTKTKQMDDFLDEIKSRHQLRHEVETLKDTLKRGTLTVAEQLRVKERLAGLQSKLGGVTTLQESEMIGKAMRGDQHHGDYQDDEETANLYIGNLPFGVTEDMLIKEFGKYGSITSVKIMYPRTDEERSRGYVPAFIAFSSREEAQAAKEAMESGPCTFGGAMMRETILRVGWGKAMNSAQVKTAQRNKSMLVQVAQQQGGEGVGASTTSGGGGGGGGTGYPISTTTTTTLPSPPPSVLHSNFSHPKPSIHVHVEVPKSDKQRSLIDKIARMVADNGRNLEQVAIMRVQARNGRKEKYNFLFDYDSPQAQYYRWRTFAYAQGDSGLRWRTEPFIMCQANPLCSDPTVLWHPPPCRAVERSTHDRSNSSAAADGGSGGGRRSDGIKRGAGGRSRSKLGGKMLTPSDKALLMDKLANLASTNRYVIKDLMVWCIDHTESSNEIVDMIIHEMKEERKDRLSKIPLLYLVSDILHNSGCSTKNGAWSYRTQLESKCAQIMAMFRNNTTTTQCENDDNSSSSIAVEKCCSVLNAWEQNAIFAPEYMSGLAATLMRTPHRDHDLSNINTITTQEERGRHFSQLERYCRNNGLLWEYPSSITDAEGKKEWLLLQIINERLYHNKNGGGGKMGDVDDDVGIDGESVGSDDISIATSDDDEEDEEDIDGEALILPGDGIEEVIREEKEERKAVDSSHTTTPTIIDDDESLDGSPL
ncbi:U2 snRNP-associated SURP domain-containing protein [Perkinsus olseni]|uniref:U2 snRNP-associated SURP domain-containing protein n=1 Tax=Perkinsus olseni TaxID=32597 RepID=A0A7J6QK17_PEROL|nr:U2 snRNP-associated SURP domain-containing protein [Perkinsus olseni]